jgi:hypothetical protein
MASLILVFNHHRLSGKREDMAMRAFAGVLAAILACFAIPASAAGSRACRSNQQYVPNWGCLSKAVIAQAKRNCLKGPARTTKWTECLCEDSGKVVADRRVWDTTCAARPMSRQRCRPCGRDLANGLRPIAVVALLEAIGPACCSICRCRLRLPCASQAAAQMK